LTAATLRCRLHLTLRPKPRRHGFRLLAQGPRPLLRRARLAPQPAPEHRPLPVHGRVRQRFWRPAAGAAVVAAAAVDLLLRHSVPRDARLWHDRAARTHHIRADHPAGDRAHRRQHVCERHDDDHHKRHADGAPPLHHADRYVGRAQQRRPDRRQALGLQRDAGRTKGARHRLARLPRRPARRKLGQPPGCAQPDDHHERAGHLRGGARPAGRAPGHVAHQGRDHPHDPRLRLQGRHRQAAHLPRRPARNLQTHHLGIIYVTAS
ncbi:hypothetical protein EMIHUDRAFT_460037, partial [Emiliania huxleyi CCMP1516]|uniref:Uncharacterized protein n=2 Tax=Emiliania huxleyi TaxID=2903 RepID=A0A0D3I941_EMIH1